jgi:hypothetical protein
MTIGMAILEQSCPGYDNREESIVNLRKTAGVLVLSAAALTATVATASPTWASVTPQACSLGASAPNGSLDGTGSRSGCSNPVTLTVEIYKDVPLSWDPLAGRNSRANVYTGSVVADGGCVGHGNYYTYAVSSTGNSVQSGRVTRC